jgi:hypothetical protein
LVPDPSPFEVEIVIEKLKRYKSPGMVHIVAELIQAGGETFRSEVHKLIHYISNKEEFPEHWKESITVSIYRKGDKTDCSSGQGILALSTSCKILSNTLLSRLSPYVDEIIEDHQHEFLHNRPTTDHIFLAFIRYFKKIGVQGDSTSAFFFIFFLLVYASCCVMYN